MPQFNYHLTKSSLTLRKQINVEKALNYSLPIGNIAEGFDLCYGYDGVKYYVGIGFMGYSLFGTMKATLDQAKQAYEAIKFNDIDVNNINFDNAQLLLKEARKKRLEGDNLMFFFADNL